VFVSTNIDYLLRNLGTKYLVISGRAVQRWRMISTESARPQLRHEVKRLERNGIPESTNV
jgi:hypothetical protein